MTTTLTSGTMIAQAGRQAGRQAVLSLIARQSAAGF